MGGARGATAGGEAMSEIIRLGRWEEALCYGNDAWDVDAVITDPPYGDRTHSGQEVKRSDGAEGLATEGLGYEAWTPDHVHEFIRAWAPRNSGWFACMTSHDLAPAYEAAYRDAGLTAFAPVPCVMKGSSVRLAGDGPSSWTVWLMVARPKRLSTWGTLPGAYTGPPNRDGFRGGGKPEWLMRAIVRDYSRPGDLVCDPCAGAGTTLLAALSEGRRAIGAEVDAETYEKARRRLMRGHTPPLFPEAA